MLRKTIKFEVLIYPLLVVVFILHALISVMAGGVQIFDEKYYVPAANNLLHGVADNFEHPPLVKLIMAASISLFGDNGVAWRLPIILFAVLATFLTYKIARNYFSETQAVYASALLSTSVIFFLVGSTAILDMPMIAFSFAGIYFMLKQKYIASGVLFGLGFLCKELALVFFAATLIYLLVKHVGFKKILPLIAVFVVICFVGVQVYDVFYQQTVYGVTITNPFQHAAAVVIYQLRLNGIRSPISSDYYPAIGWVTPFGANSFNPQTWCIGIVNGKTLVQWVTQPNPFC